MRETYNKIGYALWDNNDFIIPKELLLDDDSSLSAALTVFYAAGGYDYFKVVDPEKYALNWLDFVGNLYSEIENGKYKPDGTHYTIPLSEAERISLIEQGVPAIFTTDY